MTLSRFFYEACVAAQRRRDYSARYKVLAWVRWAKR